MPQLDKDFALYQRSLMSEEVFFAHIRAHVVGVVYVTLGRRDEHLAGEIASAVLLGVPRFEPRAMFSSWVWRIARNLALKSRRSDKGEFQLINGDRAEDPAWDMRLTLEEMLGELEDEELALLYLHLAGSTDAEISSITGLTPNAVKLRRCASRKKLKEGLHGVADVVP